MPKATTLWYRLFKKADRLFICATNGSASVGCIQRFSITISNATLGYLFILLIVSQSRGCQLTVVLR
jgi:hypothetical protein